MDVIQKLYDIHSCSIYSCNSLRKSNRELHEYIESNMPENEKVVFADTINEIIKSREEYFFTFSMFTAFSKGRND